MLIIIAIFFALTVIVRSYTHVDNKEIKLADIMKAAMLASVALVCLITRETYFALPDEGTVTLQYIYYRQYLLWGFIALMAYIVRLVIYLSVYHYRRHSRA